MTDDEFKARQLQIEENKLKVEKQKVWSSALSTAVPILITALTIWSGFHTLKQTATNEFARQAAQIVLDSSSPDQGSGKAKFLASLFGSELPADFAQKLRATDKLVPAITSPDPADMKELIKLLTEHPQQRKQILADWKAVFDEPWIDRIH